MRRDRLEGVRTARRVEPATRRQRRAYPTTVRDDGTRSAPGHASRRGRDGVRRGSVARSPRRTRRLAGRAGRPRCARVQVGAEPCVRRDSPPRAVRGPPGRYRRAARRAGRGPGAAAGAGPCCGHGVADRLGHDEAGTGGTDDAPHGCPRTGSASVVDCGSTVTDARCTTTAPRPARRPPRTAAAKSSLRRSRCGGGQHDACPGPASAQADRRARPLARRAERIARPARVRMRSRKPWVFARRRLFGW